MLLTVGIGSIGQSREEQEQEAQRAQKQEARTPLFSSVLHARDIETRRTSKKSAEAQKRRSCAYCEAMSKEEDKKMSIKDKEQAQVQSAETSQDLGTSKGHVVTNSEAQKKFLEVYSSNALSDSEREKEVMVHLLDNVEALPSKEDFIRVMDMMQGRKLNKNLNILILGFIELNAVNQLKEFIKTLETVHENALAQRVGTPQYSEYLLSRIKGALNAFALIGKFSEETRNAFFK